MDAPGAAELRERLARARLLFLFTPALCPDEPLGLLAAVLPHVDLVQVRVKLPGQADGPSPARELHDWTLRALSLVASRPGCEVPVTVNDSVDVARALLDEGCAGVHLGEADLDPERAREFLGPTPLIGLSTHSAGAVARAAERPVDYLGFGPVHPSATRGYERGLGAEAAWIAYNATELPLFPIGGIGPDNVGELESVGRAAVSSAITTAPDPGAAARSLRALLSSGGD